MNAQRILELLRACEGDPKKIFENVESLREMCKLVISLPLGDPKLAVERLQFRQQAIAAAREEFENMITAYQAFKVENRDQTLWTCDDDMRKTSVYKAELGNLGADISTVIEKIKGSGGVLVSFSSMLETDLRISFE